VSAGTSTSRMPETEMVEQAALSSVIGAEAMRPPA
jgi:hypothetical protein